MGYLIEYIFARGMCFIINRLPWHLNYWLALRIGDLLYWIGLRKDVGIKNLLMAFGEKYSIKEYKKILRNTYRNCTKGMIEFCAFPRIIKKLNNIVDVEGLLYISRSYETGKGMILVSGHIGNWHLIGPVLVKMGYRVHIILKEQKNLLIERLIEKIIKDSSVDIIVRNKSPRPILEALNKGEIVEFLVDQDGGRKGVFVDFFGRPASTFTGPVTLALRTGVPILFVYTVRLSENTHKIVIEPPIELINTGNKEKDLNENVGLITKRLEEVVRRYPDQWLWIHRRWQTV